MFKYILKHSLALVVISLAPVFASFLLIAGLWVLCDLSVDSEHATKAFFMFVCGFCVFAPCAVCAAFASFAYFDWAFGSEGDSARFKRIKDANR